MKNAGQDKKTNNTLQLQCILMSAVLLNIAHGNDTRLQENYQLYFYLRFFCERETRRRRGRNYAMAVVVAAAFERSNSCGRLRLTAFNDRKAIFLFYHTAIDSR